MPDQPRNNRELDRGIVSLEKLMNAKLDAMAKALELAREVESARFDSHNAFREESRMKTETFVTRSENDLLHKDAERRLQILENAKSKQEGKTWMLAAVFGVVQAIILLFLKIKGAL